MKPKTLEVEKRYETTIDGLHKQIKELQEKLDQAVEVIKEFCDGTNYEAHESQSYGVWTLKRELMGEDECGSIRARNFLQGLGE